MTSVEYSYFDSFYLEPLKLEWSHSKSYVHSIMTNFDPEEYYIFVGERDYNTSTLAKINFDTKVKTCSKVYIEHSIEGETKAIHNIKN